MRKPVIFLTFVFAMSMSASFAQTVGTNDPVLAERGKNSAKLSDYRAGQYALSDAKFTDTLKDPKQVKQALDEILSVQAFTQQQTNVAPSDESQKKFLELSTQRARLSATLMIAERRAQDAAAADTASLERRAREIYQTTERSALKRDLAADFQHILFDMRKRSFAEVTQRIELAEKALAAGESFDSVVAKYSDDDRAAETKGILTKMAAKNMDNFMAKTLFDELKPGQTSKAIPSRIGLHIVKLLAIQQPDVRPYEEVREAMYQRLIEQAGQEARTKMMEQISTVPTKFNEAELAKVLIVPSKEALEYARQLNLENAKKAREVSVTPAAAPPAKKE